MWDSVTQPNRRLIYPWCILIVNSSPPGQNGRLFADDMFNCIFLNENIWISNEISLRYVPWGLINNMPVLVPIMAWRRPGDKPLSEPMLTQFTDAYMRHWGGVGGDELMRPHHILPPNPIHYIHPSIRTIVPYSCVMHQCVPSQTRAEIFSFIFLNESGFIFEKSP